MGPWPLASMLLFDSAGVGFVLILQIPALPIALATFAALALAHPFPVPTCITAIISPEKKTDPLLLFLQSPFVLTLWYTPKIPDLSVSRGSS